MSTKKEQQQQPAANDTNIADKVVTKSANLTNEEVNNNYQSQTLSQPASVSESEIVMGIAGWEQLGSEPDAVNWKKFRIGGAIIWEYDVANVLHIRITKRMHNMPIRYFEVNLDKYVRQVLNEEEAG